MDDFEWTIEEQQQLEWEIIEAVIKPEQTKDVTPKYEAQSITPDEGFTLGRVNVGAIPPILLQNKQVTPTKQTQNVTADDGYAGLESVVTEPIPDEYIIPTGKKQINITQNGTTLHDVTEYADAEITANVPTGLKNGEIIKLNHEIVEVGENNIQTGADMAAYIAAAKISTGILTMISIRQKPSYQYNEMMGFGTWRSMNSSEGARYRNGQLNAFPYGNSSYSCICPVGTIFDVYYCEAVI